MTRREITDVACFAAKLARASKTINDRHVGIVVRAFIREGRRADALAVRQCNDPTLTEEQHERRHNHIQGKVDSLLSEAGLVGWTGRIHGDPRGCCLTLHPQGDDDNLTIYVPY